MDGSLKVLILFGKRKLYICITKKSFGLSDPLIGKLVEGILEIVVFVRGYIEDDNPTIWQTQNSLSVYVV